MLGSVVLPLTGITDDKVYTSTYPLRELGENDDVNLGEIELKVAYVVCRYGGDDGDGTGGDYSTRNSLCCTY